MIAKWFFNYFLQPLFSSKFIEPKQLIWPEPNEDMYSFDAYFKVVAEIFNYQNRNQAWKDIAADFDKSGASKIFEAYSQNEFFKKRLVVEALIEEHQIPEESQIFTILKLN